MTKTSPANPETVGPTYEVRLTTRVIINVSSSVCMYVCMYVSIGVCIMFLYLCTNVCMYVRMYACMYIWKFITMLYMPSYGRLSHFDLVGEKVDFTTEDVNIFNLL